MLPLIWPDMLFFDHIYNRKSNKQASFKTTMVWCRLTLSWEESWRVSGWVGSCRRAVSQVCCRSWVAVGRRWGSMCNILRTRSLASFDTLAQLPLAKSSLHSLIRCRMSVGVSFGPFANGLFLFKPKRKD